MFKNSRFSRHFDKQQGKRAQALLKSASHHLNKTHWSLPRQLSWRKSLFLACQILEMLVNTLTTNENYPVVNRGNLTIPIQMHLSQKQNSFSEFLGAFSKSKLNFKYFEKKMTLTDFVFPKLRTLKTWSDKCLKRLVSEECSTNNMVNVPSHYSNLHDSIIIKLIDHFQVNLVGRSLCFSYAKSWDCLLTHWLPMKSILFLIETF